VLNTMQDAITPEFAGKARQASRPVRWIVELPSLATWSVVIGGCGALAVLVAAQLALPAGLVGVLVGAAVALVALRRLTAAERKRTVELERLLDRRAEQVAALSHELRTPITMIRGSTDLLLEGRPGKLTVAQEQFLTVINHQCIQVMGLCESLLIQAKIEAGLFTLRPERIDISVVTRDVVTAMRPLCAERGQSIALDTPQVTPRIKADPMLLTQALTNLLSNASRFTSVGGHIAVRVATIDNGIAVYVTDDGAGMTRDQRSRLFQRFATGRPLADGTGLGLVITKTIVELHGGTILVDTSSTRGTTFLLTLPLGRSA
jgi:two-component system OmpR family sensor kinase